MFEVDFCGYNLTEIDNFTVRRINGSGDYLFLLLLTPFFIYSGSDRQPIITEPMACILFPPDEPHHYQSVSIFKNSFIHFTPSHDFVSEYKIPLRTVMYPQKPDMINQLLKNIVIEAINKPIHYERRIDSLAEQLFIDISRELHDENTHTNNMSLYSQFIKIRMSLIGHCEADWNTESICRLAHMEKSQFYNCYTSFFKTTPKADIITARIEKAKNLLTNKELNINQVAEMCGFRNASHFARYFKKRNNCTPSEYSAGL